MTSTSGTASFSPALGEFIINAFARCGIRRTEILTQHMQDARFEANLINADWSASGVNLWSVDQISIPLLSGTATYNIDPDTIFLLDVYISVGSPAVDTLIFPISRSDYAAISNKTTQGKPNTYWFDRLLSPTITLWPVPNASSTYTLKLWRATQLQDATLSNGTGPEIPYRFFDAFAWQLAARLATIYAPDRAMSLDARAQRAWQNAISSDTENVGIRIIPNVSGYFR